MNRIDRFPGSPSWTVRREGSAYYVNVLARTEFLPDLATTKTVDFPLATGIWSADWQSAVLSVKYSSRTSWTASGTKVEVFVTNCAVIPEEPQTTFLETTNLATSSWTQAQAGTNKLETVTFSGAIGPQLRVTLRATNAHTGSQVVGVTLTVDLVGRTG